LNSSPAGANYWWYRGQTGPAKDSEMRAFLFLLLLFPLVELAVLIKVGSVIGVGWTLFLIVASAFSTPASIPSATVLARNATIARPASQSAPRTP